MLGNKFTVVLSAPRSVLHLAPIPIRLKKDGFPSAFSLYRAHFHANPVTRQLHYLHGNMALPAESKKERKNIRG
jgi:hypothetical protein